MRNHILAVLALLLLVGTPSAHAAGLAIRWDHCAADGGTINRAFACDTNSGTNLLVASFFPTKPILQKSGAEIVIDIASAGTAMPQWWQFKNSGTCRHTALTVNFSHTTPGTQCADWTSGNAAGGLGAYQIGLRGANTSRALLAVSVPPGNEVDLSPGVEYFACNLVITNIKTLGTGSCGGCVTPVCIVLNQVKLTGPNPANDVSLHSGAIYPTWEPYALWQGGGGVTVGAQFGCPAATPARRSTWEQVKTLYR